MVASPVKVDLVNEFVRVTDGNIELRDGSGSVSDADSAVIFNPVIEY